MFSKNYDILFPNFYFKKKGANTTTTSMSKLWLRRTDENPLTCNSQVLAVCNAAFCLSKKGCSCQSKCKARNKSSIPLKMKGVEINRIVAGILKKGGVEFVTGMKKMLVATKDYSLCPNLQKKLLDFPLPPPPVPKTGKNPSLPARRSD